MITHNHRDTVLAAIELHRLEKNVDGIVECWKDTLWREYMSRAKF